ncbi:uncharacterized protein LOC110918579 [Helianthus annuus]|uniref:uncharacterized protein LOC110918579 n=1 Tax=Helianthus annuus TaxID=4232 RepID=UPI000B8EEF16|nr:uncharacterized protein LOC110918579 [Helianthus annuus]
MEDDRENPIEITLWPEKRNLIGNETIPGDILAITSTLVTDFNGSKQLESTNATTIVVNPTFPEIQHHVDRLKASLAGKTIQPSENTVTVQELKNTPANKTVNVPQSRFTCYAPIKRSMRPVNGTMSNALCVQRSCTKKKVIQSTLYVRMMKTHNRSTCTV